MAIIPLRISSKITLLEFPIPVKALFNPVLIPARIRNIKPNAVSPILFRTATAGVMAPKFALWSVIPLSPVHIRPESLPLWQDFQKMHLRFLRKFPYGMHIRDPVFPSSLP